VQTRGSPVIQNKNGVFPFLKEVLVPRSSRIQTTHTEANTLMHESRLTVHRLIAVGAICLTIVALPAAAQLRVGDHYQVTIDSARDYRGVPA